MKQFNRARKPSIQPMLSVFGCLLFGPLVWSLHFALVYGVQTLHCVKQTPAVPGAWIIALTIAASAGLAFAGAYPRRLAHLLGVRHRRADADAFLAATTRALALLSLFAVIAGGAAALFLAACPALR